MRASIAPGLCGVNFLQNRQENTIFLDYLFVILLLLKRPKKDSYTCSRVSFNLDIGKKSGHVVWILGVEILPALKKSMRSRVTPSLSNWHWRSRHIQYSLYNCNFEDGHKVSFLAPSCWLAASPHQDGEGGTIACQDQRKTCITVKCIR